MRFKSRICWQDWKKNTENFLPQLAASSANLLVEDFRLLQSASVDHVGINLFEPLGDCPAELHELGQLCSILMVNKISATSTGTRALAHARGQTKRGTLTPAQHAHTSHPSRARMH